MPDTDTDTDTVLGHPPQTIRLIDETGGRADGDRDPVLDVALGAFLLQQVGAGGSELLRVYRPRPTLAFSGRDCVSPGIGAAAAAAVAAGFAPVRRGPGGRAAAYHPGTVCLDHIGPIATDPTRPGSGPDVDQIRPRFTLFADVLTGALRSLGVDAQLGPVPGEYCRGEFSINDGRGHKLVGTAQRLVRGAWLFGTVIVVEDADTVRSVLEEVYRALELDWDPASVGAVRDVAPDVGPAEVVAAVVDAYRQIGELIPADLPAGALDIATGRRDLHLVTGSGR
ncbi:lipoate--protein ligase family protein [Nakamurella sp. GG22]